MADLFSYTPSQAMVTPQSPVINKQPNMQAANAFKALQETIGMVGKAVAIEKEQDDLKQAREGHYDVRAYAAAFNTELSLAGEDRVKRQAAFDKYTSAMDGLTTKYSEGAYSKFYEIANTSRFAAQKMYDEGTLALDRNDLTTDMGIQAANFVVSSLDKQKQQYSEFQERGAALGMTKREIGQQFVSAVTNNLAVSMNLEDAIKNKDYSQIAAFEQVISNLQNVDSKLLPEDLSKATNYLGKVKSTFVSAVESFIDDAANVQDLNIWKENIAILKDNGLLTQEREEILIKEYAKKSLAAVGGYKSSLVQQTLDSSGFLVNISEQPKELQEDFKKGVTDYLTAGISSGKLTASEVAFHRSKNQTLFNSIIKEKTVDALESIKAAALKKEVDAESIKGAVGYLNQLNLMGMGSFGDENLSVQALAIKSYVEQGDFDSIKSFYSALRQDGSADSQFKIAPKTQKEVQSIYALVPKEMQTEAHKMFSILQVTMDKEKALKLVKDSYKYSSVDGAAFKTTPKTNEWFTNNGLLPEDLKYLSDAVFATDTDGTPLVNPDVAFSINDILNSGDARVTLNPVTNQLDITSEELDMKRSLPFSNPMFRQEALKQMKQMGDEERKPTELTTLGAGIADTMSKFIGIVEASAYATSGAVDLVVPVSVLSSLIEDGYNFNKETLKLSASYFSDLNNTDYTFTEAANKLLNRQEKLINQYLRNVEKSVRSYGDTSNEWMPVLIERLRNYF